MTKFTGTNGLGLSQIFDNGLAVGIGTSTPGAKLDVAGAVKAYALNLPNTLDIGTGVVTLSSQRFMHGYSGGGEGNTFLGLNAGNFTTVSIYETGLGYNALQNVSSGFQNVGVGSYALAATNTGSQNTALGHNSLQANTSGAANTAAGNGALFANGIGVNNVSVGAASLASNSNGSQNSALGTNALYGNTTGGSNVAIGAQAGAPSISSFANVNTTGSKNTFVGFEAGPGTSTQYTNSTAIGANAIVTANNVMVLGSINGQNGAAAGVNVGIGKSAPDQKLHVDGGLRLDTATAKPACSVSTRGTFWVTQGATNVKDSVEVCAKDAANAYAWRTIY
jgi:hypothetical protein